jgi:sulfotransferase
MGLPRSGNTVVAALLNQHPEVYCSPLGITPQLYSAMKTEFSSSEDFARNPNVDGARNLLSSIQGSYYFNIQKPVVVDRSKYWFLPPVLEAVYSSVNPSPKFIYTIRPLLEVLASYVMLERGFPTLVSEMVSKDLMLTAYMSEEDAICDYLVNHKLLNALFQLRTAMNEPYRKDVLFLPYGELVKSPERVMKKVFEFIEVDPSFKNDLNSIKKLEEDKDSTVGNHPNLHTIRKTLSPSSLNYRDILSASTIDKYKNIAFWDGVTDV